MVDGVHLYLSDPVSSDDGRADPESLGRVINDVLDDPTAARARISENAHALMEERFDIAVVANRHLETLAALVAAS